VLTWGRLIVAGHLLEDKHRSADRVAAALEFPSGSAFRNVCQRYLGATPSEIRDRGGSSYVIRSLLAHVQDDGPLTRLRALDAAMAAAGTRDVFDEEPDEDRAAEPSGAPPNDATPTVEREPA
jgi:hypothetical protein